MKVKEGIDHLDSVEICRIFRDTQLKRS